MTAAPSQDLITPRLRLCVPRPVHATPLERLARDRAIADTTLRIPHPYPPGGAADWMAQAEAEAAAGQAAHFIITELATGEVVGATGLTFTPAHARGELGYWVGVPYWRRGYATEAARAAVDYGFRTCGLNRVEAHHLSRNAPSGRVLQKLGMRHEGTLRQFVRKWDRFEDIEVYGLLRAEWERGLVAGS